MAAVAARSPLDPGSHVEGCRALHSTLPPGGNFTLDAADLRLVSSRRPATPELIELERGLLGVPAGALLYL